MEMDSFNSTMVRLKDVEPVVDVCTEKGFNSTMVRLKGDRQRLRSVYNRFQFHYGTIKRGMATPDTNPGTPFQFHYGTIKR